MRLPIVGYRYGEAPVSIHAPWEGCDLTLDGSTWPPMSFQFTHPGKGATDQVEAVPESLQCFNSRTLGRVRLTSARNRCESNVVSIHAPWEGCDYRFNPFRLLAYQFQFTHPGKGATGNLKSIPEHIQFQFTHPGKGATRTQPHIDIEVRVSIHAPWEGCDDVTCTDMLFATLFQFTHPGKGATE